MKLKEISDDTVIIDASFEEKFNLAGVLRQSLVIKHGGIDIGTYAPFSPREDVENLALSVELQARDRTGLKLTRKEVRQIHHALKALVFQKYNLEVDYGARPELFPEFEEFIEHIGLR